MELYLFYWFQIKKLIIFAKIHLFLQVSYHKILNSGPKGTEIDQLDQKGTKVDLIGSNRNLL